MPTDAATPTLTDRIRAALATDLRRVDCTLAELQAAGKWNSVAGTARVVVDGVEVKVREHHDATSGETWYVATAPRTREPSALDGAELLTTPEEDFGSRRWGREGNEPV